MNNENELFTKISKILRDKWNPIGISELPDDEYDAYIPQILKLIENNSSVEAIAQELETISLKSMGIGLSKEKCLKVSSLLLTI